MFWDSLNNHQGNTAVIEQNSQAISYAELSDRVTAAAVHLRSLGSRQLGLLFTSNTLGSLIAYLACLQARHVPLLLPAGMAPELAANLQEHYKPDWVMGAHLQEELLAGAGLPISVQAPPASAGSRIGA